MQVFNRWLLIFAVELFGLALAMGLGLFQLIYDGDPTKLGLIIPAIWVGFSLWVGHQVWVRKPFPAANKFMIESLQALGLVGTVGGFIIGLADLNISTLGDPKAISDTIGHLLTGTAIALYATLMGIMCSIMIHAQALVLKKLDTNG
jgi:hypothetical protein